MTEASLIGFQAAEIGSAICTVVCVVVALVGVVLIVRKFLK